MSKYVTYRQVSDVTCACSIITQLFKNCFSKFCSPCGKIVQKAFCKEWRSPLPTQTSTINSQSLIASAMFLCREYNPCVMSSNLYTQVFPRYPCLGPVRRSQAGLVAGSLGALRGAKKYISRTTRRLTVCSYASSFPSANSRSSQPKSPGYGASYI